MMQFKLISSIEQIYSTIFNFLCLRGYQLYTLLKREKYNKL